MTVKRELTLAEVFEQERKEEIMQQIIKLQKEHGDRPEIKEILELLVQKGEQILRNTSITKGSD